MLEHKLATKNFYVNRKITLPTTKQTKQKEWNIIITIAKNNVFPLQIIHKLKNNTILKTQKHKSQTTTNTTKEKTGHLHVSQSTHTKGHKFI